MITNINSRYPKGLSFIIYHLSFSVALLCCAVLTACQDGDWDAPATDNTLYGNRAIAETGVISIQDLLNRYPTAVSIEGNFQQIQEDIQIKGYVTCNDRTGNMYKEITIQDETAAITIGIGFNGIFGFMPEGQEILVALRDLYLGNYRLAAVVGMPYKDNSDTWCVGRMPIAMWQQHFTYTGKKKTAEEMEAMMELFADGSTPTTWNFNKDAGKLGILKNVTIKEAGYYDSNSKNYVSGIKFAPGESALVVPGFSTSWYFNEQPSDGYGSVQLYTSSYADYAANLLPAGKMNIKGIVKRYRQQWEFIIRDFNDIEPVQ